MIIEFCVRNYLSIKDELKISFMATTLKEPDTVGSSVMHINETGLSILRSGVIYGANASGKSNVLKAFEFFTKFIINSFKQSQAGETIEIENFRLNATSIKQPTSMECTFIVDEYIYRYGFELTNKAVIEEWLYQKLNKKHSKEVEIFYRESGKVDIHTKAEVIKELVGKNMIRENALILSTAAQFNETRAVSILQWLNHNIILFGSEEEKLWNQAILHLDEEAMRKRIVSFAKYADLGIDNIIKSGNRIVSSHKQYNENGNKTQEIVFTFNKNESEGTIKYFSLSFPIIDALDNGKRLIIDELDSKLHPLLIKRIIGLFNSEKTNPKGAQLLFTTHDTFFLNTGLFRRDQIWFTQKDNFGATEAYSLAEYKVRSNSQFERDYLQGRYGATPIIGEMENIFLK